MYCSSCGSKLPEGAAFCEKCGAKVTRKEEEKQFSTDEIKQKAKTLYNGVSEKASELIRDIETPVSGNGTEPLHGLLKFLVYAAYASCAVLVIYGIIAVVQIFKIMKFIGRYGSVGRYVFLILFLVLFYAAIIYMVWKMASKIKDRDQTFLKFYHSCAVITLVINLILQWIQNGFGAALVNTLIYAAVYFGFTLYFCKSEQVRKYMGSDDYIRLSPLTAPYADRFAKKPEEVPKEQIPPASNSNSKQDWAKMENAGKSAAEEIVCSKCGAIMPADSLFCETCGTKIVSMSKAPEIPAVSRFVEQTEKPEPVKKPMVEPVQKADPIPVPVHTEKPQSPAESPIQNNVVSATVEQKEEKSELLKELPVDGNGSTIRFYTDKVAFDGKEVRYRDVAVLQAEGSTSSTYGLVTGSHFSGHVNFQTYDGIKNMLKISGTSVYGIGGTKGSQQRYQSILHEVINIAARKIAGYHLEKIQRGNTIELSGFTIDSQSVTGKRGLSRETVYVTKDNFGSCSIVGHGLRHGVFISDKAGEKLLAVPQSNPNAYVLYYVVNGIFR